MIFEPCCRFSVVLVYIHMDFKSALMYIYIYRQVFVHVFVCLSNWACAIVLSCMRSCMCWLIHRLVHWMLVSSTWLASTRFYDMGGSWPAPAVQSSFLYPCKNPSFLTPLKLELIPECWHHVKERSYENESMSKA